MTLLPIAFPLQVKLLFPRISNISISPDRGQGPNVFAVGINQIPAIYSNRQDKMLMIMEHPYFGLNR